MSLECKIYQKELRILGYGLPLYEPNPAEYDRVRVGDVGIAHKNGYFRRIFNALPQLDSHSDHDINSNCGVPEGFEPLPDTCQLTTTSNEIGAGSWLQSDHVKQIEGDVDFSVTAASVGARVNFIVSNRQAAALRIKYSAERVDASRLGLYRAYMLKHYKSWARFIREQGFEFELRDMILVTGHDLTANWATATLIERASQGGVTVQAGDSVALSASAAISGVSESSIHVPIRVGPNPYNPPARSHPLNNDSLITEDTGPFKDQCIFLRGFRVSERLFVPRIMKAAAEPEDLDVDRDSDTYSGVVSVGFDSDEEAQAEEEFVDHNFVLDTILRAGAEVAIVHETDICALAKVTGNSIGGLESVADFRAKGMEISIEFDPDLQKKMGTVKNLAMPQSRELPQSDEAAVNCKFFSRASSDATLVECDQEFISNLHPDPFEVPVISMTHPPKSPIHPPVTFPPEGHISRQDDGLIRSPPPHELEPAFSSPPSYNSSMPISAPLPQSSPQWNQSYQNSVCESKASTVVERKLPPVFDNKFLMDHFSCSELEVSLSRHTSGASDTTLVSNYAPRKKTVKPVEYPYSSVPSRLATYPAGGSKSSIGEVGPRGHRSVRKNPPALTDNNPENLREVIKVLQSCILELRAKNIRLQEELDASRFT